MDVGQTVETFWGPDDDGCGCGSEKERVLNKKRKKRKGMFVIQFRLSLRSVLSTESFRMFRWHHSYALEVVL